MRPLLRKLTPIVTLMAFALPSPSSADGEKNLRLGLIGLDTSHVVAFTAALNNKDAKNHVPGGTVVAAFKGGSPDIEASRSRVDGFTKTLVEDFGVKLYDSIGELCDNVDAVLLTSVDGRPHLEQARPVIQRGLPLFIDKPVAGNLRDTIELFRLAKTEGVPCFSTSSLRFYPGVVEIANADVGELRSVISYGPATVEPHHPDLFWYGIHPTEALFTVLGPGCQSVVRTSTDHGIVVTGLWEGGKIGTLFGIRSGKAAYKVTAFGSDAIAEQKSGGDYTPMLREIIKFFNSGIPPVSPAQTIEIYAFMEAADESARQGGVPVQIADVIKANSP